MDSITRYYAKPDTYKQRNTSVNAYLGGFKDTKSLGGRTFYTWAMVFLFSGNANDIISNNSTDVKLTDAFSGNATPTGDLWIVLIPGNKSLKTGQVDNSADNGYIVFSGASSKYTTWDVKDGTYINSENILSNEGRGFLDNS